MKTTNIYSTNLYAQTTKKSDSKAVTFKAAQLSPEAAQKMLICDISTVAELQMQTEAIKRKNRGVPDKIAQADEALAVLRGIAKEKCNALVVSVTKYGRFK